MAKGYSVDLRERVIAALQRGGMTDEQAAKLFQIGEATVHRWKRLKRETGALEPRPRGGGYPPRIAPGKEQLVREIVADQPDLTIQEAAWEFHRRTGTSVSRATMGRTLRKLGLTRKKKSLTATEQETPRIQELRRRFVELAKSLDPRRLVFIDEAGSHIAMTREYARAPRGERAHGSVPRNAGTVTTMIGALDLSGVRAMMTVEGATDAEVFETFVERVLARKLRSGEIVVLDNVGALPAALLAGPESHRTLLEQAEGAPSGVRCAVTQCARHRDQARDGPHRPARRDRLVPALRLSTRVIRAVRCRFREIRG